MPTISFPYGKGFLTYDIHVSGGNWLPGFIITGRTKARKRWCGKPEHPVGSPALRAMAEGKKRIVLIASDHTRPVPSRIIVPPMLEEIRRGSPGADITILIATGCHRETTREELEGKFGPEIIRQERIVVHDCDSPEMVKLGKLPSGRDLIINKLAAEADLQGRGDSQ